MQTYKSVKIQANRLNIDTDFGVISSEGAKGYKLVSYNGKAEFTLIEYPAGNFAVVANGLLITLAKEDVSFDEEAFA